MNDLQQQEYRRLVRLTVKWMYDTRFVSSVAKKAQHPAYQQIVEMGMEAVPYILNDMIANGPNDWFWALSKITGANPITEDMAGDMAQMAKAWIDWGWDNGHITLKAPSHE